jgi:hypothetical protein
VLRDTQPIEAEGIKPNMRAKISAGVWIRRVPWKQKDEWRTDMFKHVLADPCLHECHFILKDGPTVLITANDLRSILPGGADRYAGKIWGPFNIDPTRRTIAGIKVHMQFA